MAKTKIANIEFELAYLFQVRKVQCEHNFDQVNIGSMLYIT